MLVIEGIDAVYDMPTPVMCAFSLDATAHTNHHHGKKQVLFGPLLRFEKSAKKH